MRYILEGKVGWFFWKQSIYAGAYYCMVRLSERIRGLGAHGGAFYALSHCMSCCANTICMHNMLSGACSQIDTLRLEMRNISGSTVCIMCKSQINCEMIWRVIFTINITMAWRTLLKENKSSKCYSGLINSYIVICDWLWENPPVTHKDDYLEKRNWIIQSVISPEGLKLQACNLQRSYSYSRSIRLSYLQCTASWISCHFR